MNTLLGLIKSIKEITGNDPCKKTVQKIIYLIQEINGDLGFDYSIHFYGPYSADLDFEIRDLSIHGYLSMNITDNGHILSVNDPSNALPVDQAIQNTIAHFRSKNPSCLELLATTLYVQREIQIASTQKIIDGVIRIKGTKYPKPQINTAIDELVSYNYFNIA